LVLTSAISLILPLAARRVVDNFDDGAGLLDKYFGAALMIVALLGLAAPSTAQIAPTATVLRYRIDAPASNVKARVGFFGIASKTARFPKVSGGIELQPSRLDTIRLDVTLDATALEAGDEVTLKRLKSENFFDVARHPTVRFLGRRMTMTGPVTATIDGDLTARGISRPVTVAVSFANPPAKATGREPIRLNAQTKIDRTDFGMNAYRPIVARSVTITIDAQMVPN
ncbi:MAG: YceI family protein, partial [Novosphingobium sp.]|nr:YceI family protein [Novosphingobium sp.]